jgi:nicotinamidase/pyrazinamidase
MRVTGNDALIVVDVQNDFCPGGALPVPDATLVVRPINLIVHKFDRVVFSRDWHPRDHCSFGDPPEFRDGSWPEHCVENTPGAEFHGDLIVPMDALVIDKGTDHDKEAYSAFQGTVSLLGKLKDWDIARVFVAGLATDFCVRATALDAQRFGFETWLVVDAVHGVTEAGSQAAIAEMRAAGVCTVNAGEIE